MRRRACLRERTTRQEHGVGRHFRHPRRQRQRRRPLDRRVAAARVLGEVLRHGIIEGVEVELRSAGSCL